MRFCGRWRTGVDCCAIVENNPFAGSFFCDTLRNRLVALSQVGSKGYRSDEMKIEKGNPGYIKNRKKIDFLWLLAFVALGVGIFLIGYFLTHVRANIFTVLSVLMVLPAAKHIVALIVLLPRKGVSRERYERMEPLIENGTLYTDYVFTSTDRIMQLDFLLVKNGNVLGVLAPSKQDTEYMKKYLLDCVKKAAPGYHVQLFESDEKMISHVQRLTKREADEEKEKALLEYLHSLAM